MCDPLEFIEGLMRGEIAKCPVDTRDHRKVMQAMTTLYCRVFAEDPRDGSTFDMDVMNALHKLGEPFEKQERIALEPPFELNIRWGDQLLAAEKLNHGRVYNRLKPYPPLVMHAIAWAKDTAWKNQNQLDPMLVLLPNMASPSQRLWSYGFRGTHVGEWVTKADSLDTIIAHAANDPAMWAFLTKNDWRYCGVGKYTIKKDTFWCINLGTSDE